MKCGFKTLFQIWWGPISSVKPFWPVQPIKVSDSMKEKKREWEGGKGSLADSDFCCCCCCFLFFSVSAIFFPTPWKKPPFPILPQHLKALSPEPNFPWRCQPQLTMELSSQNLPPHPNHGQLLQSFTNEDLLSTYYVLYKCWGWRSNQDGKNLLICV